MLKRPEKSQLNVLVKEVTHNKFKRMAKKLGVTQTSLIEKWINEEYKSVYKK